MTELKNIDFWKSVLEDSPESYKKWFSEEKKLLQETITKDSLVLDIGCGNGRSINDFINITTNIVGIDHDDIAVTDAKKNFKDYPNVKILKADARKLPFENDAFDFVICMGTFANFGDYRKQALLEMKRVLKKDGKIIISSYSEDAFEERMTLYKKEKAPIKEIKGTTVYFDEEVGDNMSEQFSKEQLQKIFAEVGLDIADIKKAGIGYICKLKK